MTDLPASLSPVKKAYRGFLFSFHCALNQSAHAARESTNVGNWVKTVFGGASRKGSQLMLVAPTPSSMSRGASTSGAVPEFL